MRASLMKIGASALLALVILLLALASQPIGLRESQAEDIYTNSICPSTGGPGCYTCPNNPSGAGNGCVNGDVPTGWRQAACEGHSNPNSLCTAVIHACGTYLNCASGEQVGTCYYFPICK